MPVTRVATPASGASVRLSTTRAAIPRSESTSRARSTSPGPAAITTTRQPSATFASTKEIAPSTLPWNEGITAESTVSASSPPIANGLSRHHTPPRSRTISRRRAIVRKSPAPRSIGAEAPEVAALHAASRNSRFVSPRVIARALERSGSTTAVALPSGRYSASDFNGPATAGRSDSMPSTGMPSAIFSSICEIAGNPPISARARSRTSGVSSSSRLGGRSTRATSPGSERWSATEKARIWSTSSPKNSMRYGCSDVGGNTSRMPPRTANSPRRDTMSTRE